MGAPFPGSGFELKYESVFFGNSLLLCLISGPNMNFSISKKLEQTIERVPPKDVSPVHVLSLVAIRTYIRTHVRLVQQYTRRCHPIHQ